MVLGTAGWLACLGERQRGSKQDFVLVYTMYVRHNVC